MNMKKSQYIYQHVGLESRRLDDLYFFLLKTTWPRLLLLLAFFYSLANVIFAVLYLLGGDCINAQDPHSFLQAFSFSVQTMTTIGYGGMAPTTNYAHILITIEAFVGLVAVAMGSGLMFAKFSRPVAKVKFSKNLVVNPRDGVPCLQFRMSNLRNSKIIDAHIRVYVIKEVVTLEGHRLRSPFEISLKRNHTPVFPLSWLLVHELNEQSPLYPILKENYKAIDQRLIVSFFGHEENLSQTIFAQHVYHMNDIILDAHFEDMHTRLGDYSFQVDHSKLDQVKGQN